MMGQGPGSAYPGSLNQRETGVIRSPQTNDANIPNREVFDHFFAMEVTWK